MPPHLPPKNNKKRILEKIQKSTIKPTTQFKPKISWKERKRRMNEAAAALEKERKTFEKERKTFLDEFRELILHQFTVKSISDRLSEKYRDSPLPSDFEFFEGLATTPQIKFLISLPNNKKIFNEIHQECRRKKFIEDASHQIRK